MLKKRILISSLFFGILSSGCVSSYNKQIMSQNKALEEKKEPIRLHKMLSTQESDWYSGEWAGKKGNSIALNSKVLFNDILLAFQKHCGFLENDLIETRIVSHKNPIFYEVWVFKDEQSKRQDKTSALSVLLTQLPKGGGVDMDFRGSCHSEPLQFIFQK